MDFVLLHGTTQSPAGWARLADELTARGHHCHCVDLMDVDASMPVSGYAADIASRLSVSAPVVVAHSGAGMLLPSLGRALRASRLVFLAAWIPDGIHGVIDEFVADPIGIFHRDWIGVDPTSDEAAARRFLFHDCDEATTQWALSTLRAFRRDDLPQEVGPFAAAIPSMVIVPEEDRTLRADWMCRAARDRVGVEPMLIPGGHCPHVSRPELLADLLCSVR